ncbi:MAG: PIN domain-containing protein [Theionarchaea archaeon]|nr:PIN domain-containing protein [Theionarchaea archaeon]
MTGYVIDTCILVEANKDMKRAFQTMRLLMAVLERHRMCLDTGREILKEYEKNGIYEGFSGIWFKNMQREAKIDYVKKKIEKRQKKELIKLKFDKNDIKFVATANTCGNRIISDDSDYNDKVIQYLKERMGITVYDSDSELE